MYAYPLTMAFVLVLAFLTGCDAEPLSPDQMDWDPSTTDSCPAPCWHGLEIGKSTEAEAMSVLATLAFLDPNTITVYRRSSAMGLSPDRPAAGAEIVAECVRPHKPCVSLQVAEGVLTQIDISLNYQTSVAEVIADLGPPDYVGSQLLGVETLTCEVVLIWSGRQLVLNSDDLNWRSTNPDDPCVVVREHGKTTPDLVISEVSYKTPAWIEWRLIRSGSKYFEFT
jgi:hypothetical protein